LQELESFRRHDDVRRKRTSAGSLAISTVTVKHHNRFCCGLVANRAASASAWEGCGYCGHILFMYWVMVFVRSMMWRMSEWLQDIHFSRLVVLAMKMS